MRVLVVGGTGFIGPRVVRRLVDGGREVAVFHRGRKEADLPEGVERVRGDRRKLGEHAGELRRLAPDVVLDMVLDMVPMNERDARGLIGAFRGGGGRGGGGAAGARGRRASPPCARGGRGRRAGGRRSPPTPASATRAPPPPRRAGATPRRSRGGWGSSSSRSRAPT